MTAAILPTGARKRPTRTVIPTGLKVIREVTQYAPTRIASAADVYRLMAPRFAGELQESMICLILDTQSNVRHVVEVTRGILNGSLVHPREVYRPAIVAGAAGIILVHNHPSGDPTPSPDDRAITRQIVDAGRILDVHCYDHIIIGEGRYTSFVEMGIL